MGNVTEVETALLAHEIEAASLPWASTEDMMRPTVFVRPDDDLRKATEYPLANALQRRRVRGLPDERRVAQLQLAAEQRVDDGQPRSGDPRGPS